jgi:hypothetical protein
MRKAMAPSRKGRRPVCTRRKVQKPMGMRIFKIQRREVKALWIPDLRPVVRAAEREVCMENPCLEWDTEKDAALGFF